LSTLVNNTVLQYIVEQYCYSAYETKQIFEFFSSCSSIQSIHFHPVKTLPPPPIINLSSPLIYRCSSIHIKAYFARALLTLKVIYSYSFSSLCFVWLVFDIPKISTRAREIAAHFPPFELSGLHTFHAVVRDIEDTWLHVLFHQRMPSNESFCNPYTT